MNQLLMSSAFFFLKDPFKCHPFSIRMGRGEKDRRCQGGWQQNKKRLASQRETRESPEAKKKHAHPLLPCHQPSHRQRSRTPVSNRSDPLIPPPPRLSSLRRPLLEGHMYTAGLPLSLP